MGVKTWIKSNWHSASSPVGYGTPGYKNSQYSEISIQDETFTVDPPVFTPDNDGVSDFDELRDGTSLVSSDKKVMKKEIIVDVKNFTMKLVQNSIVLEEIEVSTGKKGWETPKGNFNVLAKVDVKNYFNHPNVPYNLEFAFNKGWKIYIHSAPWHNDFGKKNV